MRNCVRLVIDLTWVALSAFLALFIRDNLFVSVPALQALVPYALISVATAAIVFTVTRLHRTVWRYTSLLDALHLIAAVTVALLLALLAGFALNRLEGVARSLPVIQWLLLVGALISTRIAVRLWQERGEKARKSLQAPAPMQHALVVGVNDLTELYLSSVAEFAPANFAVVGILSRGQGLRGRSIRQYKVLGAPEEVSRVLAQLDVHGVTVDRIVVMQRFDQLSRAAREALLQVERSTAIEVEWFVESLGWGASGSGAEAGPKTAVQTGVPPPGMDDNNSLSRRYAYAKRAIDLALAIGLLLALWPFLALVALMVAIDVGLPIVFWQQRPGRHGRPFKLFKFRTMHPAHDSQGKRIPEEFRSSRFGSFLRRSRLDELPQLYNIFVGEMSFVGPRPLLPADQPQGQTLRLLVRPGLTGWAQINGGRCISAEHKAALDIWYIMNASFMLDVAILRRTLVVMVLGDGGPMNAARAELEKMKTKKAVEGAATLAMNVTLRSASAAQKTP